MPIELADYVAELVQSNPLATDPQASGDDHFRLLKRVLQNTFPDANRPFRFPKSQIASTNLVLQSSHENATILVDASQGSIDVVLPILGAGDAGWSCWIIRTTAGANQVRVFPPAGTIHDLAFLALTDQYQGYRVVWTGQTYYALRTGNATVSWTDVAGKPTTFAPATHTHLWADISDKPTTFPPVAHRHDWADIDNKPSGDIAPHTHPWNDIQQGTIPSSFPPSAHSHAWADITSKPSVFPPSAHSHPWSDITPATLPATWAPSAHSHSWDSITGKPATFPAEAHTHGWADITGKPSSFPPSAHSHGWGSIDNKPTTFPPDPHSHKFADLQNIPTTLAGYGITNAYTQAQVDSAISSLVKDLNLTAQQTLAAPLNISNVIITGMTINNSGSVTSIRYVENLRYTRNNGNTSNA